MDMASRFQDIQTFPKAAEIIDSHNDRIAQEAMCSALKRELAAKDAEIAQLVTKCNRLMAALKPVIECDVIFWREDDPWYADNHDVKTVNHGQVACTTACDTAIGIANCHNAVREALNIVGELDDTSLAG